MSWAGVYLRVADLTVLCEFSSCWYLLLKTKVSVVPEIIRSLCLCGLLPSSWPQACARTLLLSTTWRPLTRAVRNSGPREPLCPGCSPTSKPWPTVWKQGVSQDVLTHPTSAGLSVGASNASVPQPQSYLSPVGWQKAMPEGRGSHLPGAKLRHSCWLHPHRDALHYPMAMLTTSSSCLVETTSKAFLCPLYSFF